MLFDLSPETPLATVKQNPIYRKLMNSASFRAARNALLRSRPPPSEVAFVQVIAVSIVEDRFVPQLLTQSRHGYARDRKRVLRAVNILLEQEDVALVDPLEQRALTVLLEKLKNEIEATPRKRYERASDDGQWPLDGQIPRLRLAVRLASGLGVASSSVLEHACELIGAPCDRRTAQYTMKMAQALLNA